MKKAEISHKTPKEIVKEMNNYIIGQDEAKKLVAIAFVNRGRRMMVEDEKLRSEITPKNVLLSGPTGVGKTEIARRVADITDSPFIKVEMTKFTEVGYAGKDVETIIRDLVEITIKRERNNLAKKYEDTAKAAKDIDGSKYRFTEENGNEHKFTLKHEDGTEYTKTFAEMDSSEIRQAAGDIATFAQEHIKRTKDSEEYAEAVANANVPGQKGGSSGSGSSSS